MEVFLLNGSYEGLGFITLKRAIKLIYKNKAEIVSSWDDSKINWFGSRVKSPATIKLKYYVNWTPRVSKYYRSGVFKRDNYTCQYCGAKNNLTVDHIIPRSKGGVNSWKNCVTSCHPCNSKKKNLSLEESGMKLFKKPTFPEKRVLCEYREVKKKHKDWKNFI